jgi:hypothetical protein
MRKRIVVSLLAFLSMCGGAAYAQETPNKYSGQWSGRHTFDVSFRDAVFLPQLSPLQTICRNAFWSGACGSEYCRRRERLAKCICDGDWRRRGLPDQQAAVLAPAAGRLFVDPLQGRDCQQSDAEQFASVDGDCDSFLRTRPPKED